MPPHTRATARAEASRLTPTVLQRRSCGASSTPSFRFCYSPLHSEHRFIGSASPSAQIEEVDNEEIEYEEHGDIDNEINLVDNAESSAEETEAEALPHTPQAPPVQQPSPQPRAAPQHRAAPQPSG